MERNRRNVRQGVVVSDAMDKTITVLVEDIISHPVYKKKIVRSKKYKAHDEKNEAQVGDKVVIMETRALSKTKRWRLVRISQTAEIV